MKLNLSFWTTASSKRKRIYLIILMFIIAFILTVVGSYVPLSHPDAQSISGSLNATLNAHKSNGSLTEYIFVNNFSICLLMFVPLIGPVVGMFILFDTGIALGAISSVQGYPAWVGLVSLIITPVFWLEFTAYSTAMAASIWLFRRILQGRWREIKNTAIFIGICAAILVVGAIVEVWLISIGV
jgi:stage II sporulation SpoM-like protein